MLCVYCCYYCFSFICLCILDLSLIIITAHFDPNVALTYLHFPQVLILLTLHVVMLCYVVM